MQAGRAPNEGAHAFLCFWSPPDEGGDVGFEAGHPTCPFGRGPRRAPSHKGVILMRTQRGRADLTLALGKTHKPPKRMGRL